MFIFVLVYDNILTCALLNNILFQSSFFAVWYIWRLDICFCIVQYCKLLYITIINEVLLMLITLAYIYFVCHYYIITERVDVKGLESRPNFDLGLPNVYMFWILCHNCSFPSALSSHSPLPSADLFLFLQCRVQRPNNFSPFSFLFSPFQSKVRYSDH